MKYKGIKLFGTENHDKEPIAYIDSEMGANRHDNGKFINFAECPSCGTENLSRIVCQFCGQRFIEEGDNLSPTYTELNAENGLEELK